MGRWLDTRFTRKFVALAFISAVALPMPAAAQEAGQIDLSAGYLNISGGMHGANTQIGVGLSRNWSLVGEFNWARGRDCAGCEPEYRDWSALGGFRYAFHPTPRFSPFWQVLAGGLSSSAADHYVEYCCNLGTRLEPGYTVNYWALQPGGGVTMMLTPRVGLRAQADLQLAGTNSDLFEPGEGYSIFPRVAVGALIRLGK